MSRRRFALPLDLTNADAHLRERFWSKVDVRGADECWEWNAHRKASGYGQFVLSKGIFITASRASLAMVTPLGPREVARHTCDNPPCVNPAHLVKGTQVDNALDSVSRGRARRAQGEACASAKLTAADVLAIRAEADRYGLVEELGRKYGVAGNTIRSVRVGRTWRSVA